MKVMFCSSLRNIVLVLTSSDQAVQGYCLSLIKRSHNRPQNSLTSLVHYHWWLWWHFN